MTVLSTATTGSVFVVTVVVADIGIVVATAVSVGWHFNAVIFSTLSVYALFSVVVSIASTVAVVADSSPPSLAVTSHLLLGCILLLGFTIAALNTLGM